MILSVTKISSTDRPAAAERSRAVCTIEIVRGTEAFDAAEHEWSALVDASPVSVFQTHEWLRTWWTYFGGGDRLSIMLFRDSGRLVGIAPLFIGKEKLLGLPAARHVQFIGRGLSDYADIIMLPGFEEQVLHSFAGHLVATHGEWDILDLEDLNEQSNAAKLLPGIFRAWGIDVYEYQGSVCPYVELPASADELVRNLGAGSRYTYRRKLRNIQSQFTTAIELVRRPEDDIEKAVAEFSRIHGERWKSLGFPSAFDDAEHRAFHVEIARKFAEKDWLRMFFLSADGLPVAVTFCFNYKARIYMYQSNAYGSDAVMKCSPGFIVRSVAMTEGIAEGMRVFDFLRGDEEYKYREWSAVNSQNWLFRARSPRPGSMAGFVLFLAKELGGKIRKRAVHEYYEFRRMRILKRPTPGAALRYLGATSLRLLGMGGDFILRHSPFRRSRRQDEGDRV